MRKLHLSGWFLVLGFVFTMTSCNNKDDVIADQTDDGLKEIEWMVEQAGTSLDNQVVITDELSGDIFILNEGITPDFLADETSMEELPEGDTGKVYIRDHSFIHCLKGLSLSDTQTVQIKKTLRVYRACNEHAIQRAKEIYHDLREKYQGQFKRLLNAYNNGSLTPEEFKRKAAALKEEFKAELRRLHLKEKLDVAFKTCLRECFGKLHGILDERQWGAFKDCVRQ